MSYIEERRDISTVKDPKSNKGIRLQMPQNTQIIHLPTKTATHILKTFPGDAGSPMVELANKLFGDLRDPPPPKPPEDMELDATVHPPSKQAR